MYSNALQGLSSVVAVQVPGVVAPSPSGPSWLNTAAIVGLIVLVAGLVCAFIGLSLLGKARKGNLKDAANTSGVALIGLLWIVIGIGGSALALILGIFNFVVKQ